MSTPHSVGVGGVVREKDKGTLHMRGDREVYYIRYISISISIYIHHMAILLPNTAVAPCPVNQEIWQLLPASPAQPAR